MPGRKQLDPDCRKDVAQIIQNKEMGNFRANRIFSTPQATLEYYIKESGKSVDEFVNTMQGMKPSLSNKSEASCYYGGMLSLDCLKKIFACLLFNWHSIENSL
jgi:hypothetical protein